MKLPNWLKITWWVLLTFLLTLFMYKRYPDLIAGQAVPADIVIFVIWVALLLAPLFSEVAIFGIKLKQDIEDFKKTVSLQISDVKNEIRSSADARASVHQLFNMPTPAPDAQLPAMEEKIKVAIAQAFAAHGLPKTETAPLAPPEDVAYLFAARYNIERELRRIAENRPITSFQESGIRRRPLSINQLSQYLIESELVEPRLIHAIREVYAICSPAIHGEKVSPAQLAFVQEITPELIGALRSIK